MLDVHNFDIAFRIITPLVFFLWLRWIIITRYLPSISQDNKISDEVVKYIDKYNSKFDALPNTYIFSELEDEYVSENLPVLVKSCVVDKF